MSTLIVTAHPDPGSLTHAAAAQLYRLLGEEPARLVHLAQEGFDPRFTSNDRAVYTVGGTADPDVVAEQQRLDGVSDLVLVFPVYWWSLPALLKGWIDRVFVAGWAFEYDDGGRVVPLLGRLTMHLLPLSGTSSESFARHGYTHSFSTSVEHGIIDFCGIQRGKTAFIYESESADKQAVAARMDAATAAVAAAITATGAGT